MANAAYQQLPQDLREGAIRRAQRLAHDAKDPKTYLILLIVAGLVTLSFAAYFAVTKAKTEDDVHHVKLTYVLAALASLQAIKMLYTATRPKSDHTDAKCLSKMTWEHGFALVLFALLAIACSPLVPFARYTDIEIALPIEFELLFGTYVCWELSRIPSRFQKMKEE